MSPQSIIFMFDHVSIIQTLSGVSDGKSALMMLVGGTVLLIHTLIHNTKTEITG